MKKTLLRTAVAVASGAMIGQAAATAVDQTATPVVPIYAATENVVAATGTNFTGVGAVKFAAGFSIATSSPKYVRIDLTGATWAAQQLTANLAVDQTSGAGAATETIAAGGATTDSFVIYEVVASSGTNVVAAANEVNFTPQTGVTVTNQDGVSIAYALYETASEAVSGTNALASDSGTLINFVAANSVAAATVASSAIDVTVSTNTGTVFANGTNETVVGAINIADNALTVEGMDGTAVTTANVEASSVLTVTGDMTWLQDLDTANVPDGTYTLGDATLNNSADCADANEIETAATSIADGNVVFTTTGNNADIFYVCLNGNGVTAIPEAAYTASYVATAATNFQSETTNVTLNTLAKNGASQTLNLVLTPGGNYKNFLRVSNTSAIAGDVSFSLRNDAGTQVTGVALGDIAGQSSSSLSAQASTSLINVNDLYAAAQAKDATFDADASKLRVVVTGNFQSIDVQNISTSNDNNSFDTF